MTDRRYEGPNAEASEAWDTVLFDKFMRFREILTDGLAVHSDPAYARLALRPGMRVLDVGCGLGDTTRALAKRVAPGGEAVGVDVSGRFIELAGRDAEAAGVANARFMVRDAQSGDLGGPYDVVFSRFGTMFFASPVQALRNFARALAPGGTLCMIVWRKREDNAWAHEPEKLVKGLVAYSHEEKPADAVTCGPGPFSMAGADLVGDQLIKAGFERIAFERHDTPFMMGRDLDEAVAFAMALGPAGEILRLASEAGAIDDAKKASVLDALRTRLGELRAADGAVVAGSSAWFVTASRGTSR